MAAGLNNMRDILRVDSRLGGDRVGGWWVPAARARGMVHAVGVIRVQDDVMGWMDTKGWNGTVR